MSSFQNSLKSVRHAHRERGQLQSRHRLGLLEKKKDYVLRAKDFHRKQDTIRLLKNKAMTRNDDEFYHKMINTKTKNGMHIVDNNEHSLSQDVVKVLKTQDAGYVNYKRSIEAKQIDRLKSNLHLLSERRINSSSNTNDDSDSDDNDGCSDGISSINTHTIFLDSTRKARKFNPSKYFDTIPNLAGRTFNRPRIETLEGDVIHGEDIDEDEMEELGKTRDTQYRELSSRIDRSIELNKASSGLELQRTLMNSKGSRQKVGKNSVTGLPVYRWKKQRKR